MATKDRTTLKDEFKNGNLATGERFADLIDSVKVVQLPVVDPQALGTSLSFIDSISQDEDGKITATKKTLDLANAHELNPFKGWYKTGDTLPTDGFDGAYLYFKDTSELTGQTTIYRWNGTAYADTGTVVDTSNVQTFETGQAVNAVGIKDLNGNNDPNAAGVLSAEAGKALKDDLYGEVDESVQQEVTLPSTPIGGGFRNTTVNNNAAFYYDEGSLSRCAYVDLTDYINAGYKKLRVVMPQETHQGGLTFVKRMDAPTATSTYAELVAGGYLSSVHDAGDNVLFRCLVSGTDSVATEFDIPTDAVGVCFRYKAYTDGSASDTVRKPSALYVYGVHKAGDIGDVERKVDGVTLSEEDSEAVVNLGMYIRNGKPQAPTTAINLENYGYSVIDVSGADRVRFSGVLYGAAKNRYAGYAFYTNENNGSQTDGTGMIAPYVTYPNGTQTDTEVKDYTVAVPTNAKWLFVTSKLQFMPDFKCVLIHDADTMEEKFEQVDARLHKIENLKLKILVLGNSYAMDSFMYVPFILKNYGVNIELGIYRRSGGTLAQCVEDWDTPASEHTFDFIDTAVDGAWRTREDNMSPKLCVDKNEWDIVVIQQQSEASTNYETYVPYARQLIGLIRARLGRGVMIGWNITINRLASGSDIPAVEAQILTNIAAIVKREGVGMLFPYGAAVFDARTNATLDALGKTGHLWYDDHLQDGLPRYLAACASVQAIFNRFYPKLSVMGDVTDVTETIILNDWKLPSTVGAGTTYGIVAVTDENRYLAQICAVIANNYPLEICDIES